MARLGYARYGAGQRLGHQVSTELGPREPAHVAGIDLSAVRTAGSGDVRRSQRGRAGAAMDSLEYAAEWDSGYSREHATRPQTVGYGLVDSPAFPSAWIVEKFWSWTDHPGARPRSARMTCSTT